MHIILHRFIQLICVNPPLNYTTLTPGDQRITTAKDFIEYSLQKSKLIQTLFSKKKIEVLFLILRIGNTHFCTHHKIFWVLIRFLRFNQVYYMEYRISTYLNKVFTPAYHQKGYIFKKYQTHVTCPFNF